jgi:cephalosporin hydroxylase
MYTTNKREKMNPLDKFQEEKQTNIRSLSQEKYQRIGQEFIHKTAEHNYSYNFTWLGQPIIQFPQDMIALQEIIWSVKPDMIIETGIAHGGSLIFSASMLALLEISGEISDGKVLGIDIDIREHNRELILKHPMSKKITMIEGSSIDPIIIKEVQKFAKEGKKILLLLDSNHTHEHVLAELNAYASLVSLGSYCIVYDTGIEDMPDGSFPNRPWGKGNNPKTALKEFLKGHNEFSIDKEIEGKLLITVAPDGYLKRVK